MGMAQAPLATAQGLTPHSGTHAQRPRRHAPAPGAVLPTFVGQVVRARKALGEELLPMIRLHDLCHSHAILLLADGVPVEVVSERSPSGRSRPPPTGASLLPAACNTLQRFPTGRRTV